MKTQGSGKFKGVTVNGIPLDDYIGELKSKKVEKEVMAIVRASKCQHLYHSTGVKCSKPKEERNGPVMKASSTEVHQRNAENYFKAASEKQDIRSMVVAVLLTRDDDVMVNIFDIKKVIDERNHVKSGSIRSHMNFVMKSKLAPFIETKSPIRNRAKRYKLNSDGKALSFPEACNMAVDIMEKRKKRKPEKEAPATPQKNKNIEFVLTDTNELPVLKVEGRIDIHFHLHWGK